MGGISPLGGILGAAFGPGGGRGRGVPGRLAARAYTDPRINPKYAPSRGPLAALYSARVREAAGKPMAMAGGRGASERALAGYEAGGAYGRPLTGATSAAVNPAQPGGGGNVAGGQGSITRPLSEPMGPEGLTFGGQDPLQRRTELASQAVSGEGSFMSPEALKYYYDLSRFSLIDPAGVFAPYESIQPIEHQFLNHVLRQTVPQPTTQGFLEAVRRGTASL